MSDTSSDTKSGTVIVPAGLHFQSRLFAGTASLWRWLGSLESRVLQEEIRNTEIVKPVYVCSLARAGTTIVTEMLDRHPDLTSHRYSDFPNVWTPYWRNHLLQQTRRESPSLSERAHGDRIQVNNDSPEAVEEVLWMAFFDQLHHPSQSNVLDNTHTNAAFDQFYSEHIRKLLAVRSTPRYLAKGNYNVSRLAYILNLFSDARFIIPIREPAEHIASLAKQHTLFVQAHEADRRVGLQLSLAGHFEFGPNRTCINFGDQAETDAILSAWQSGNDVEGWALYWAATYNHLADQLEQSSALAQACLLFRYEDLCTQSTDVIDRIVDHCDLPGEIFSDTRNEYAGKLTLPDYYRTSVSGQDLNLINTICNPVLDRLQSSLALN